jgi:flagellar biogenesis protein FliO
VGQYLLQSLITLIGLGLLMLVLLFVGRRGRNFGGETLQLLGRLQLDGRRAVYVVRVGPRVFVLAGSEHAMTKVAELSPGELPEVGAARPLAFAEVFRRVLHRSDETTPPRSPTEASTDTSATNVSGGEAIAPGDTTSRDGQGRERRAP